MKLVELTSAGHHEAELDGLLIGHRPARHEGSGPGNYSVWTTYYLVRDEAVAVDDAAHAAAFGRRRDAVRVREVAPGLMPHLPLPAAHDYPEWHQSWTPRQVYEALLAAVADAPHVV
jgi:hypothetical protein